VAINSAFVSPISETLPNNANEEYIAKNYPEIAQALVDLKAEMATITELHKTYDAMKEEFAKFTANTALSTAAVMT
jgi:hypothetical protein